MSDSKKKFTPSAIPVTRTEIANSLGISYSTFKRWLQKKEIDLPSGLVYPEEQELISEKMYGK